jgi:hypothetical protein
MEKMFAPPANVNDFALSIGKEEELKAAWHKKISKIVNDLVEEKDSDTKQLSYPHFYNPLKVPAGTAVANRVIPWSGFPRVIESWFNLNPHSSVADWKQAFEIAEINNKVVIGLVQYFRGGQLVDTDRNIFRYNPGRKMVNYKVKDGKIDSSTAFHQSERIQDEYLEWFVYRDENNRVEKISFTSEGPEYWDVLSKTDPDLTVKLYQQYAHPKATKEDLYWQEDIAGPVIIYDLDSDESTVSDNFGIVYNKGEYNPYNQYNTTAGIMHLIQRNNTLGAEIRLAADGTKQYPLARNGADSFRFDLCACAGYGAINRNSDPTIGDLVNTLATSGHKVTISDPIGLYIGDVQIEGITDKDGNEHDKDDLLVVERGDDNPIKPKLLRFSIVAPADKPYGLEGYKLGDQQLTFGGPVAKLTSITIYGEAIANTDANFEAPCGGKACVHPEKPAYRQVIGVGDACDQIKWNNVKPPFELPENIKMAAIDAAIESSKFKTFSLTESNKSASIKVESIEFNVVSKRF